MFGWELKGAGKGEGNVLASFRDLVYARGFFPCSGTLVNVVLNSFWFMAALAIS